MSQNPAQTLRTSLLYRNTDWLNTLHSLSADPLRRAAQIALAAVDEAIASGDMRDDTGLCAAYEALQSALK